MLESCDRRDRTQGGMSACQGERKIAVVLVVKKRTVMTNEWIAGQLNMGAPSRVSRYCSQAGVRADVKSHIKRLQMSKSKD